MLTSIQLTIAKIALVLIVFCGGCWWVYNKGYDAADNKWKIAQAAETLAKQAQYNEAANKLEEKKEVREENAKTITKVVTKIVTREIYHNQCIDNDGRLLINEALTGSKPSSVPDAALSTSPSP